MICEREAVAERGSCTSVCPSPKAKDELGKPHAKQTQTSTGVLREKRENNKTKQGINPARQPLGLTACGVAIDFFNSVDVGS